VDLLSPAEKPKNGGNMKTLKIYDYVVDRSLVEAAG
jgi:hypothetical protein